MISAVKQSALAFGAADLVRPKSLSAAPRISSLPSICVVKNSNFQLSTPKHLYLPSLEGLGFPSVVKRRGLGFKREAYEADRSENIEISHQEARSAAGQKLKIGIYFATWWALNVVFNIYNKKVLNAFPYPWLTSTLSLATGSLMMLVSWATRIAEAPKTDFEFWKALAPVRKMRSFGQTQGIFVIGSVSQVDFL
ncbi:hypothetical protein GW17_00044240 [Ensete ventricosum]|nr:hypothetical protein GW17_00044240 [Ensete ventricosum]RZR95930.1 hypothetical protein BHM03_00024895 [Ensete ventricosum]